MKKEVYPVTLQTIYCEVGENETSDEELHRSSEHQCENLLVALIT